MPQFFVERTMRVGDEVALRGGDARHVLRVLRLAKGDWLMLSDGRGKTYRAEIIATATTHLTARITEECAPRRGTPPPTLAIAIIKHDRTEAIIQKAVELGIQRIVPFSSARTIPTYAAGIKEAKRVRWQRIAHEAAKQSGLPVQPKVDPPSTFEALMAIASTTELSLLFWEGERTQPISQLGAELKTAAQKLVIIGPEGGFAPEEVARAQTHGVRTVSLGPQILRVETAAVAALALVQFLSGNFEIET